MRASMRLVTPYIDVWLRPSRQRAVDPEVRLSWWVRRPAASTSSAHSISRRPSGGGDGCVVPGSECVRGQLGERGALPLGASSRPGCRHPAGSSCGTCTGHAARAGRQLFRSPSGGTRDAGGPVGWVRWMLWALRPRGVASATSAMRPVRWCRRNGLREQVQLANTARRIVRQVSSELSVDRIMEICQPDVATGFKLWGCNCRPSTSPAALLMRCTVPPRCRWRSRYSGKWQLSFPGPARRSPYSR